jgi:hypothetical protein
MDDVERYKDGDKILNISFTAHNDHNRAPPQLPRPQKRRKESPRKYPPVAESEQLRKDIEISERELHNTENFEKTRRITTKHWIFSRPKIQKFQPKLPRRW